MRLRRQRRADPFDGLLDDPGTLRAAHAALSSAAGADRWPYAAAVGTGTVMVHMAGAEAAEPPHPWRATGESRLWIADWNVTRFPSSPDIHPVALGHSRERIVFIDAARAPGPIVVAGSPETAGPVCELLAAQLPPGAVTDREVDGAHWPLVVQDGVLYLVGLPVAHTFSYAHAVKVATMLRGTARPARDHAAAGDAGQDVDVEEWLRHVKEVAETALERRTPGARGR